MGKKCKSDDSPKLTMLPVEYDDLWQSTGTGHGWGMFGGKHPFDYYSPRKQEPEHEIPSEGKSAWTVWKEKELGENKDNWTYLGLPDGAREGGKANGGGRAHVATDIVEDGGVPDLNSDDWLGSRGKPK